MALRELVRQHPGFTVGTLAYLARKNPGVFDDVTLGWLVAPRTKTEYAGEVLQLLRRSGRPLSSSQIRRSIGGQRWDVQAAARELERRGVVARTGVTSATRYRAVGR